MIICHRVVHWKAQSMIVITNILKLVWAGIRAFLILRAGIPMRLHCPVCDQRHVDRGIWVFRAHVKHLCAGCGHLWRPAQAPERWMQQSPVVRGYLPTRGVSYDFDLDGDTVPDGGDATNDDGDETP